MATTTLARLPRTYVVSTEAVSRLMQQRGLSVDELARQAVISVENLRRVLRGQPALMATIRKIAKPLGVDRCDEILEGSQQPGKGVLRAQVATPDAPGFEVNIRFFGNLQTFDETTDLIGKLHAIAAKIGQRGRLEVRAITYGSVNVACTLSEGTDVWSLVTAFCTSQLSDLGIESITVPWNQNASYAFAGMVVALNAGTPPRNLPDINKELQSLAIVTTAASPRRVLTYQLADRQLQISAQTLGRCTITVSPPRDSQRSNGQPPQHGATAARLLDPKDRKSTDRSTTSSPQATATSIGHALRDPKEARRQRNTILLLLILALFFILMAVAGGIGFAIYHYARPRPSVVNENGQDFAQKWSTRTDADRILGKWVMTGNKDRSYEFFEDGTMLETTPATTNKGSYQLLSGNRLALEQDGVLWGTWNTVYEYKLVGDTLTLHLEANEEVSFSYRRKTSD